MSGDDPLYMMNISAHFEYTDPVTGVPGDIEVDDIDIPYEGGEISSIITDIPYEILTFTIIISHPTLQPLSRTCTFIIKVEPPPPIVVQATVNGESISCGDSYHIDTYFSTQATLVFFSDTYPNDTTYVLYDSDDNVIPAVENEPGTFIVDVIDSSETFRAVVSSQQASTECEITITKDPRPPISVFSLIIDGIPTGCGTTYYKFCDLTATTSYPQNPCAITIAGHVQTNEHADLNYEIIVNNSIIDEGSIIMDESSATTPTITHVLSSKITNVCVRFFSNIDDTDILCCATINRLNSRIGCNNVIS